MPAPTQETDHTLDHERTHLTESREALRRMREHTAGLTAIGGDHVSTEHLKQVLYRRMKALEDDPEVPLFFGRLDYDTALGADADETLYIGRRHVTGEAGGEPLVIDWRAGMALPFYRASPADPMRVRLRRRFGFAHGKLTAYEDEDLAGDEATGTSDILESEIERPRTGPMRDIVATIQPEQDLIVRADLARSLCIQGAPGTGKTAVGLHRAAFLLYAYRDQLSRSGVLVVGPNDSFLSYIGDVLPALGEIDATQATVESLVCKANAATVRGVDTVPAALIKGDARMADVIKRAAWGHSERARGVARGATWGIPVAGGRVSGRGDDHRTAAPRRAVRGWSRDASAATRAPGPAEDGGVGRLARRPGAECGGPQQAREDVRRVLLADPRPSKLILRLLTDAEFLARAANGILTVEEQSTISMIKPARECRRRLAGVWRT